MTLFLLLAVVAGARWPRCRRPRVTMISIGVIDMDRSIRFYTETPGLLVAGPRGEVTMIRAGEITVALNKPLARNANATAGAVEIIFGRKRFRNREATGSARMRVHRCRT